MAVFDISRYPLVADDVQASKWLRLLDNYGRAPNTLCAYAQSIEQFIGFCGEIGRKQRTVDSETISLFVRWLQGRYPRVRGGDYANATVVQRLTAVRLFYEHLSYEGVIPKNPVRRGSRRRGRYGVSALVSQQKTLPWIPTETQWARIIDVISKRPFRDRLMAALAYDAALRREELCSIAIEDFDLSQSTVTIRAETSKSADDRVLPISRITQRMCAEYFHIRRSQSIKPGPLLLSASPRNKNAPIGISTWTKIVEDVREQARLPRLTTHTFRHLRLTDLARSNWDIHRIGRFAGHRSIEATMRYIHLSARDLRDGVQQTSARIRLAALSSARSDV